MITAIIGSRTAKEIDIKGHLPEGTSEIVSGGARGVDTLAAGYALRNGIKLTEFKPDYKRYRRGATFVRNREIIDYCDVVLAFWDGVSAGTKYSIEYAKKKGKRVTIVYI